MMILKRLAFKALQVLDRRPLLQRKMSLEARLAGNPTSRIFRRLYFALLSEVSRTHSGLGSAMVPGLRHPVYFRANTSDVDNIRQIYQQIEYGFEFPHAPRRILDLGAYCGYAAVYFANRFPDAEILCVEPSDENFRMLTLNTSAYANIRRVQAAVWYEPTRLDLRPQTGGHWANTVQVAEKVDHTVPGHTIQEFIEMAGWTSADFVKCDIEGAEVEVFSRSDKGWVAGVSLLAIELHDWFREGCQAAVDGAMGDDFNKTQSGEFAVYTRRGAVAPLPPRERPIIDLRPGLVPIARRNVGADHSRFYFLDNQSFQLHPNPPGSPAAEVGFPVAMDGHRSISVDILHANEKGEAIAFTLALVCDGQQVASATKTLAGGQADRLVLDFPPRHGAGEVVFRTEMSPSARDGSHAFAQWLRPVMR